MADWLDSGAVERLTLLCSDWMRRGSPDEYRTAIAELVDRRGQTVAAGRSHAKVCVLDWPDMHLAFEGSSNLRSCRALENVAVTHDADLCRFHSEWIDAKVREHAALDQS
jgi:hypothetical protein